MPLIQPTSEFTAENATSPTAGSAVTTAPATFPTSIAGTAASTFIPAPGEGPSGPAPFHPERVKAILFDLDGTLIDTEKYYHRCWPLAAAHFGFAMSDAQVLALRSLGRPYAPLRLQEWFGPGFDYTTVRNYRKKLVAELVEKEGLQLRPGVRELLTFLKERGIPVAVSTATDRDRTEGLLEQVGLRDAFDAICCAVEVPRGKPAPDVYLAACKELGLEPGECLAVEDSPNGILSAYHAGIPVIFVPDQTREEPEVEPLVAAKLARIDDIKNFFPET